jgi:hypothetical protein
MGTLDLTISALFGIYAVLRHHRQGGFGSLGLEQRERKRRTPALRADAVVRPTTLSSFQSPNG